VKTIYLYQCFKDLLYHIEGRYKPEPVCAKNNRQHENDKNDQQDESTATSHARAASKPKQAL
jgi:hypothetical protein